MFRNLLRNNFSNLFSTKPQIHTHFQKVHPHRSNNFHRHTFICVQPSSKVLAPYQQVFRNYSSNSSSSGTSNIMSAQDINERLAKLGLKPGGISLPTFAEDKEKMLKWAVIACDQYTSDRGFWEEAEKIVGEAPSTLNLMLPEVYLNDEAPVFFHSLIQ